MLIKVEKVAAIADIFLLLVIVLVIMAEHLRRDSVVLMEQSSFASDSRQLQFSKENSPYISCMWIVLSLFERGD